MLDSPPSQPAQPELFCTQPEDRTQRKPPRLHAADLFCGAGGFSTALARVCREMGAELTLTAVNHAAVAIATHSRNHPQARHFCASLARLPPDQIIGRRRLDLLLASPECVHFSRARGGKPKSDQKRASVRYVLAWLDRLDVRNVIIENVSEFAGAGPLDADGQPIQARKGEHFQSFIAELEKRGYQVEWRVLNSADYGALTARRRLFIVARKRGAKTGFRSFNWPAPTHFPTVTCPDAPPSEVRTGLGWRAARELIDFSHRGASIFNRVRRPLAVASYRRIFAGLERFNGVCLDAVRRDEIINTLRNPAALARVPLLETTGAAALTEAAPQTTPYLVVFRNNMNARSLSKPITTITTSNNYGIAAPFLVKYYAKSDACSLDLPLPTITANYEHLALCQPFLIRYHGAHRGTTDNDRRHAPLDAPLPTLTTANRFGLVQPRPLRQLRVMHAAPAEYLYALYLPRERALLDVEFRMLRADELAVAMGFPRSYSFAGTDRDIKRQIGNAVEHNVARALIRAVLFPSGRSAQLRNAKELTFCAAGAVSQG